MSSPDGIRPSEAGGGERPGSADEVRGGGGIDPHRRARRRGVDHPTSAHVNADMLHLRGRAVEEHQVPGLYRLASAQAWSGVELVLCHAGKKDTGGSTVGA